MRVALLAGAVAALAVSGPVLAAEPIRSHEMRTTIGCALERPQGRLDFALSSTGASVDLTYRAVGSGTPTYLAHPGGAPDLTVTQSAVRGSIPVCGRVRC